MAKILNTHTAKTTINMMSMAIISKPRHKKNKKSLSFPTQFMGKNTDTNTPKVKNTHTKLSCIVK